MTNKSPSALTRILEPFRFPILFGTSFLVLYGFNLVFIGFTTKAGYYFGYIDKHLNYIQAWRSFTIQMTSKTLQTLGYEVYTTTTQLQVFHYGGFNLMNSCLGYGIMSLFAAFVISYPVTTSYQTKDCRSQSRAASKLIFLFTGVLLIECMNLLRFVALAILWKAETFPGIDHHLLFNCFVYIVIFLRVYLWTNKQDQHKIPGPLKHKAIN
jgi:exosortase/archaeosortase family protein